MKKDSFWAGNQIRMKMLHECMIVPKPSIFSAGQLKGMVSEINVAERKNEEILSDHIYEYNRERGRIQQVPACYERNRGSER